MDRLVEAVAVMQRRLPLGHPPPLTTAFLKRRATRALHL